MKEQKQQTSNGMNENSSHREIPEEKNESGFWSELLKMVLVALVIVVPFRVYIAQPFIVDGASMDPTFKTGQYLIVDEISYRFTEPERGEVIVFKYPKDPSRDFIKRIIGLPGEVITINEGSITVTRRNGTKERLSEPYVKYAKADNMTFTLGDDEYFVMGDNRVGSADSRLWGALPRENIIGRPIIQFIPPALFPGDSNKMKKFL